MKFKKFPNALVILILFIFFAGILTWVIPAGQYERELDPVTNQNKVVPGSYEKVDPNPVSILRIFMSIPEGLIARADLIVLILLIGGCFVVIEKTGAFKEGITYAASILQGKEEFGLIIVGLLFATGGALNGLQEEVIAMIPILLLFSRRLGYNPFVTISVSHGSAVIGSAFSPMNPFGVAIAQANAELPILSGSEYRLIVLILAISVWLGMTIYYGNKNRIEKEKQDSEQAAISFRSILILGILALTFIIMIYGLLFLEWGFNEMSAEFFVSGMLIGIIGKLGINGTSEAYIEGFKEMIFASVIVGFAQSISIVLKEGLIMDSIIYGLFTPLQYLPGEISAIGMMISQSLLHLPVSSYSGQAILTMPILAPLSDLIGLSRQVTVLAYQYGAIMMDMIIPTNGAVMAIIALAGISYNQWFRFAFLRTLVILGVGAVAILVAIAIGF
jgi:uncharacterized ion transporter superfamily protein YfcC